MKSFPFKLSSKHNAVLIKADPRVKNVVPHIQTVKKEGKDYYLVPYKPSEAKLLTNLGYKVPSPIHTNYDWNGTTPFESQEVTAGLLSLNRRAYVLNDMGTGKTRSTLYAIDYLKQTQEIDKVLVVAPLSTLTCVWEEEIFDIFPHLTSVVLHGTRQKRKHLLENADCDIYIINHDGVKVILDELNARQDINCVVIDELASFRNSRTAKWKKLNALTNSKKWVWGLTGSPTPNAPTDAWAQVRLLTPERVPQYFKAFQNATMTQVSQFRWIPKASANNTIHTAMQPSVRYTRDQCIDLPPTMYSTRETPMEKAQENLYKDMVNKFHAEYNANEITAANEGVKLSKLLQIAGGYVYSSNGVINDINVTNRVNDLLEIIEEITEKVIVFAPYIHMVDSLYTKLSKTLSVEKVYGDTPRRKRDNIFNLFQNSKHPHVLVAHPQCMSHGLTLTVASTIVWYSPPMSLETYEQANARITRPGQKNTTYIIHMESSPIEKRVYKRLQNKGKMQGVLLDLFKANTIIDV